MTFLHALILGIVEGLTEFIPVSSTGHLILTTKILGIDSTVFVTTFIIAIQAGALLAIAIPFLMTFFRNPKSIVPIVVACLPAVIVGFLFLDQIRAVIREGSLLVLGLALFLGGIVLLYIEERYARRNAQSSAAPGTPEEKLPTNRQAFAIGLVQLLSLIPGVSRSGSSIAGGLLVGMSRAAVATFSFLVAVPLIFGATMLDLLKASVAFSSREWMLLFVGFISAFLASLVVVRTLLRFVSNHSFKPFAWYRIIAGSVLVFLAISGL